MYMTPPEKPPCKIEGCNYPQLAREMCSSHYQKARSAGTLDEISPNVARQCAHCQQPVPPTRRWGSVFCSVDCKQADRDAAQSAARIERRRTENRVCAWCREPLAAERPSSTRFCTNKCSDDWNNDQRRLASLRARKASRLPCEVCGKPVAAERRGNAIYCSYECKKVGNRSNSLKAKRDQQDTNRLWNYGVTREQFDAKLAEQGGSCAICGTTEWGGKDNRPHTDHDHVTNRFRGVLCGSCNYGLGCFKDNSERLAAAIAYLKTAALATS